MPRWLPPLTRQSAHTMVWLPDRRRSRSQDLSGESGEPRERGSAALPRSRPAKQNSVVHDLDKEDSALTVPAEKDGLSISVSPTPPSDTAGATFGFLNAASQWVYGLDAGRDRSASRVVSSEIVPPGMCVTDETDFKSLIFTGQLTKAQAWPIELDVALIRKAVEEKLHPLFSKPKPKFHFWKKLTLVWEYAAGEEARMVLKVGSFVRSAENKTYFRVEKLASITAYGRKNCFLICMPMAKAPEEGLRVYKLQEGGTEARIALGMWAIARESVSFVTKDEHSWWRKL
jgi:hypothetical protein